MQDRGWIARLRGHTNPPALGEQRDCGKARYLHRHSRGESVVRAYASELRRLGGNSIFHDTTVEKMDGPVGVLRETCVVGHHANSGATGV